MSVNEICELDFFEFLRKWGGIYTAFITHKTLMEKEGERVYVNSFRRADITHIHSFGPYALFKLLTSRPTVVSSHVVPQTIIGSFKGAKLLYPIARKYLKFFYNRASVVVALSPFAKKELKDLGVRKEIAVISNPINSEMFHRDSVLRKEGRAKYSLTEDEFVIVGVGQIIPRKGVADFVAVAKKFPDYTFVWIGGEAVKGIFPSSEEVLKEAPSNMKLAGLQPYAKMSLYYNMADVFLFPSYQEVASMVILEAAGCGLPLVLRDLPQYKILYGDGYIACRKGEDFTQAIQDLAEDHAFRVKAIAQSENLAGRFTMQAIGKKFLALYNSLLISKS